MNLTDQLRGAQEGERERERAGESRHTVRVAIEEAVPGAPSQANSSQSLRIHSLSWKPSWIPVSASPNTRRRMPANVQTQWDQEQVRVCCQADRQLLCAVIGPGAHLPDMAERAVNWWKAVLQQNPLLDLVLVTIYLALSLLSLARAVCVHSQSGCSRF